MDVTAEVGLPDHVAVPYAAPAELAARLAPRLDDALSAGAPVLAVLDTPTRTALRTELGAGSERIEFADPADVHAVPAFTVAVRWARFARRAATARTVVVGQHVELPDRGPEHWARLDIALNVAIDGLPVTVLCPCVGSVACEQTHPLLLTEAGTRRSERYRSPPEAVVDHPPPPPPELGPPDVEIVFAPGDLPALRRRVAASAATAHLDDERAADLVLAVNELASNSVEHGPGAGRMRLWIGPGRVTAEVTDSGRIDVPFPGLVLPPPSGARGRGLWLASELTDVLQVWSGVTGTVSRVTTGGT
ncbi:ATP-binding protein [Pseudonocardia sp.]|uniref:ATP-binding protein n=1 Tax=Pseudonocardia sp. TaxID=60912 RepID=UPI00260D9EEA|nr:ATP-binding protein [Pseudonocardia sp.]